MSPATVKRHTAPITPLVTGVQVLPIALVLGWTATRSQGSTGFTVALGAIATAFILALLVTGFAYLAWRRTEYYFDDDGDFRLDSGVVGRQERRLQLSRLQSVDVVQPLVARLFGLGQLTIEVAGAGDSHVQLKYLTMDDAVALRSEILARSAGLAHDTGEAPEAVLVTVPTKDLALSLILRGSTMLLLLLTAAIFVGVFLTSGFVALGAVLISGGIPVVAVLTEFARYFNFTVAEAGDGVRLRFGLLQTQAVTVPPGRVAAVDFVQPLLWRSRDWVRVRLTVAGMRQPDGDNSESVDHVLLPVAPRAVAEQIFARVLPGVDVRDIELVGVPEYVSRRSPIQWRQLAVGSNDIAFVSRRGRVVRHLTVSPHARTQSVRITQGPWERAVGVASVHLDIVPGPVRVAALHRPVAEARELAGQQVRLARAARAGDKSTRWASSHGGGRGGAPLAVEPDDQHAPADPALPPTGEQPG